MLFECEPTDNISLNSLIIVPYAELHCLSDDDKQVLFSRIKFLIKLSVYFFFQHKQMSKYMLATVMKRKTTTLKALIIIITPGFWALYFRQTNVFLRSTIKLSSVR